jgi:hypothetical protein
MKIEFIQRFLYQFQLLNNFPILLLTAKPNTSAISVNNPWYLQVTRNKSQDPSIQQRIWRKQSFLNETSRVQPVRLPRPVITGKDWNNRHVIT